MHHSVGIRDSSRANGFIAQIALGELEVRVRPDRQQRLPAMREPVHYAHTMTTLEQKWYKR
jgi:hypothetical protein